MGQPSHWTYGLFAPTDDLQQGDIIRRSDTLLQVLSEVLSHFCDERYTAFLVLTQSCDLNWRGIVTRKPGLRLRFRDPHIPFPNYRSQVLVSSHSSLVLVHTDLCHLLCARMKDDGAVEILRGIEHPRLKEWKGGVDPATLFAAGALR